MSMSTRAFVKISHALAAGLLLTFGAPAIAQDSSWQPITGASNFRDFMSGLKVERTLPNGELSRGEYQADGTGTVYSWGASSPRSWSVRNDDTVCVNAAGETLCYQLERNLADTQLYRVREVATGSITEFRAVDGKRVEVAGKEPVSAEGSAATPSASELAAELSNPNTSVASLTFKFQYRRFEGDLPRADDQSGTMLLFQPSLPFVLDSGDKVLWRPAVPVFFDQPVFDANSGYFDGEAGLGDIAFDLAYAPKTAPGSLFAFGLITSLPTASDGLGTDRWTLGPEVLIGKMTPKYLIGLFPNHQWDIGGSGNADINLTTIQAFYTYLPGGGWNVGSAPIMSYDWESEQWTLPLNVNAGKTVFFNGRPWKLSVELNYYVDQPDAFGPEWMLGLNIAPVVRNGMASWFGLGGK